MRCIFTEIKKVWAVVQKNRLLFLLGVLGLVLLVFTGLSPEKATEAPTPAALAEEYRQALREEVRAACAAVEGVGDLRVLLTLASGEIAVYEKNKSGENETVALSGGEGLLLAYRTPEVLGVAVVCEGGANPTVKAELTALLRATLGVDTRAIHIAPLK